METMNSWERVGWEKARKEARKAAYKIVLRLLGIKLPSVPESLKKRLQNLPLEQLDSLSEVALHAETARDVEEWLDQQK